MDINIHNLTFDYNSVVILTYFLLSLGALILNGDDPLLKEMIMKRRKELYSIRNELANGKDDSALKRLREVEDELLMTGRVLENYE